MADMKNWKTNGSNITKITIPKYNSAIVKQEKEYYKDWNWNIEDKNQ